MVIFDDHQAFVNVVCHGTEANFVEVGSLLGLLVHRHLQLKLYVQAGQFFCLFLCTCSHLLGKLCKLSFQAFTL